MPSRLSSSDLGGSGARLRPVAFACASSFYSLSYSKINFHDIIHGYFRFLTWYRKLPQVNSSFHLVANINNSLTCFNGDYCPFYNCPFLWGF